MTEFKRYRKKRLSFSRSSFVEASGRKRGGACLDLVRIIAFSAEFHIADAGKAVEIADRVARAVGAVGADLDGTVHEEREVFLRIQRVEPFALFKLIQRKCEIRGIEKRWDLMFLKIKVQQSRIKNSFHRKILSQKNFLENFFFIVTYDTRKSKKVC